MVLHPAVIIPDGLSRNEAESWMMEQVRNTIETALEH